MPPDTEPFGLPPRDAIRYFCRRRARPLPSWSWLELQRAEHAKMFTTVAKSAGFDILGDVADAVDCAQAQGQTLAQFQADLEPLLRKKGWWGKSDAAGSTPRRASCDNASPPCAGWRDGRHAAGGGSWEASSPGLGRCGDAAMMPS